MSSEQDAVNIAGVWKRILRLRTLEPTDSFFEIGGDSMSLVEMLLSVAELYDVEVNVDLFLQNPTVVELVGQVNRLSRNGKRQ